MGEVQTFTLFALDDWFVEVFRQGAFAEEDAYTHDAGGWPQTKRVYPRCELVIDQALADELVRLTVARGGCPVKPLSYVSPCGLPDADIVLRQMTREPGDLHEARLVVTSALDYHTKPGWGRFEIKAGMSALARVWTRVFRIEAEAAVKELRSGD